MRVVIQRTGLNPDVLRAWERRYDAIQPDRSGGGQRLYSDADIERLGLLKRVTAGGHNISQVAPLPVEELRALIRQEALPPAGPTSDAESERLRSDLRHAWEAVERFAMGDLEATLRRAAMRVNLSRLIEDLIAPLLSRVGERWHAGTLSTAHEHAATAAIRSVLGWVNGAAVSRNGAPLAVVATPQGQRHEIGAMLSASVAASEGWRLLYLGADLPAADIARAALTVGARAVLLSIVYPDDDPQLAPELSRLRHLLPGTVSLLVGGAAADACAPQFLTAGAEVLPSLPALRRRLGTLA